MMRPTYIKFTAHSIDCILEAKITLTGTTAKMVYPFTTDYISFRDIEVKKGNTKIGTIVNLFEEQLTYYLNIIANFECYNESLDKYRKLAKIDKSDNLEPEEIRDLLICMATHFFHVMEEKMPQIQIRMSLFYHLLDCYSVDDFNRAFASPKYLDKMLAKCSIIYDSNYKKGTYRKELLNFENQLN